MNKQRLQELVREILPDVALDQEAQGMHFDLYSKEYNIGIDIWTILEHTYAALIKYNYPQGKEEDLFCSEHFDEAKQIENGHQEKAKQAIEKGIMLYSFWESELDDVKQQEIMLEMIASRIGKFEKRLNARDCEVKEISATECKRFLEENHWQGNVNSKAKIALIHKTEGIVALQCYAIVRNIGWNLKRTVFRRRYQVRGGISKMFKYFIKTYDPEQVIDYTDIREFPLKHFHDKMGFNPNSEVCKPCCYFADIKTGKIVNRETCRKGNMGLIWDDNLTWCQNRVNNGLYKAWDSGKLVNVWKKNSTDISIE
ncbi:MAG: hypothetical protein LBF97_06560 [Elusimicrobiota bacterium]|jgi:hypothetical protein|nr:hypothetical protein [Elusimicrobiota bacterium]